MGKHTCPEGMRRIISIDDQIDHIRPCIRRRGSHYAAMHNADQTATAPQDDAPANPLVKLMEAIARRRAIQARYNGAVFKLAPYQLFERHSDLFLSALNLSKVWASEDERRLGQFKIAGLSDMELLDEPFEPLASYDGSLPRSEDVLVLAI